MYFNNEVAKKLIFEYNKLNDKNKKHELILYIMNTIVMSILRKNYNKWGSVFHDLYQDSYFKINILIDKIDLRHKNLYNYLYTCIHNYLTLRFNRYYRKNNLCTFPLDDSIIYNNMSNDNYVRLELKNFIYSDKIISLGFKYIINYKSILDYIIRKCFLSLFYLPDVKDLVTKFNISRELALLIIDRIKIRIKLWQFQKNK